MYFTGRWIPPELAEYFVFLIFVVVFLVGIAVLWSRAGRTGTRKPISRKRYLGAEPKRRKRKNRR
jgi:hypothetical protein